MKMKGLFFTFLIAILTLGIFLPAATTAEAAAAPVLKTGSTGGDVWDVQYRLQALGLFTDTMDGVYGSRTAEAVRKFQTRYGLAADGIVGPFTWRALRKYTVNLKEMELLARVVYSEARGEPYTGQVAVAAVVMNRLKSDHFPDTLSGVIFQRGAFTAVDDGQFWLTPNDSAYKAAKEAVRGWDPTNGALFYYNPKTAVNKWIRSRPILVKIGNHVFTS
jgi:N-acetylmuramoyl-L-alanine amidase